MMLFINTVNPLYIGILESGPFVPKREVQSTTTNEVVTPAHFVPKRPSEYIEFDR